MGGSIGDLLGEDAFRVGVLFGAAAAVAIGVLWLVWGRRIVPLAGLGVGVAAIYGLEDQYGLEGLRAHWSWHGHYGLTGDVIVAFVVLAAGGTIAGFARLEGWKHAALVGALALPGAYMLADVTNLRGPDPGWVRLLMVATAAGGGALVAGFDRTYRRTGLAPVLLAVTALGIYVTTPDTEHALVLAGAALPAAVLGWPRPLASLGPGGSVLVAGLVGWIAAVDGLFRTGSIIGAVACLGLLITEPVARAAVPSVRRAAAILAGGPGSRPPAWLVPAAAAGQLALVTVCSRVAGMREGGMLAAAIALTAHALAAAALVAAAPRIRPPADADGDGADGSPAHRLGAHSQRPGPEPPDPWAERPPDDPWGPPEGPVSRLSGGPARGWPAG